MVLKDAEGRFTIANKTFSEWFAKDGEEIVGKTSHDLYPKDVADKLRAIDLEILRSGTIIDEEIDEPFVDGSIHSMLMTKFPILGPGGKAVAVGTIETDITERKRAEEELTEKEAQLRLAMDNMSSGMRLVDKDRCNVLFNSRYIELYDYPEGLLKVGESIRVENVYAANRGDFGPGDPEKLADEWFANSPELTRTLSWESRTADGKKLQVSTTPIPSGGVINMVSDITERKRAEEELEQKEAQLRLALDNMQGGMRLIDKDRNYVFFNQQYLDLYDYPEGLLKVGVSIRVENLYSAQRGDFGPGDPDALTDQSLAGLSVQGEATSWERLITGGKTLRVHGASTPEGGYVNIVTDITERKRAEEALREARDAAEEATKAKATFLATMSHEIRTPMGGVIGMVDLLQQSKLTDDQRQMIDTVRDSAHSLLTIINDILDFSKIEAGKLDLEEIPISIRDIVEGAGEALAVNARNKNIGLSVFVDPDIPDALVGDQVRVRQILFNFGSNAIKFTEQGKVLIRADTVPSQTTKEVTVYFSGHR